MTPSHRPPPIEIARAADVATRLSARKDRLGHCHGSGDKPDSASLTFRDPKRPGGSLDVYCYKCSPRTPADYDRICHALQKAAVPVPGLPASRCPKRSAGESVNQQSTAAGALVMAMRPLDNPFGPVRKVQLVTIDAAGEKARHWQGKRSDKRAYGTGDAFGLLMRDEPAADTPYELHVCEGLADGLALLAILAGRPKSWPYASAPPTTTSNPAGSRRSRCGPTPTTPA